MASLRLPMESLKESRESLGSAASSRATSAGVTPMPGAGDVDSFPSENVDAHSTTNYPEMTEEERLAELETWVDPWPGETIESMARRVEETRNQNSLIKLQTTMFEDYYRRQLEKEKEFSMQRGQEYDQDQESNSHSSTRSGGDQKPKSEGRNSRRRSKRQSNRTSKFATSHRPMTLTATQKATIGAEKLIRATKETDGILLSLRHLLDDTAAEVDENTDTAGEYDKMKSKFNKMILRTLTHDKKYNADSVTRYSNEKLKGDSVLMEQYRLKMQVSRDGLIKLSRKLLGLEDLEGSISMVDFQQIKIVNNQYLERLKNSNELIVREKTNLMHSQHIISQGTGGLRQVERASDQLDKNIQDVERLYRVLDKEMAIVSSECESGKRMNGQLRQQVERFKVPSVMEYVGYKADMLATKKSVKTWLRRVEVAEQELRKHKVAWGMVSRADAMQDMGMMSY